MSAKAVLTPRPNAFKFNEKLLDLSVPVKIGRANKEDKADSDNGFFDCKVLSKLHALLLHQGGQFYLLDTGSSNGTFVNNIRLSKPGTESELTELFTGDIVRFGTDVLDKTRKVTQKSVILKISFITEDGLEYQTRPASSRLYRPTDNYTEDISTVTQNLQDSLSRERSLEEKLNQIVSLIETIKEKSSAPNTFQHLDSEISKIFLACNNNPNNEEKKKFENLRNEKAVLRKEKMDLEEKLKEKDKHSENLQKKAVEDSKNIASLGNIIQKLRNDISNLENVVDTVKSTQEKVKAEYEEKMMEERRLFEEELERVWRNDKENEEQRVRLEERLLYMLRADSESTRSSVVSTPTTVRNIRDSLNFSGASGASTPISIFMTQTEQQLGPGVLEQYNDYIGVVTDPTEEQIKEKAEMYESVKFELEVTKRELDMIKDENHKIKEEISGNISLSKANRDVFEDLDKAREDIQYLLSKVAEKDDQLTHLTAVHSKQLEDNISNDKTEMAAMERNLAQLSQKGEQLESQALCKWVDAAESDFESMFQENCLKKSDKNILNETIKNNDVKEEVQEVKGMDDSQVMDDNGMDAATVIELKDLKICQLTAREKVVKAFKKINKFDLILAIITCFLSYLFYLYKN